MRIAFMGSPDFAVPALRALHDAGHQVVAVFCQPARPAGRGQAVRRCPVHVEADLLGLPVHTPPGLRTRPEQWEIFTALHLDVAVVAAYGLILPPAMLQTPRLGCLNIHASLLPRWRGAAPIQAAILAGDSETGITIMQMDAGLDTGPMLLRETVPITASTTTALLHDTLAERGARLILRALADQPEPMSQPEVGATYAGKLSRHDGRINWACDARAIERQVRAFDPWPGTFTTLDGSTLKILAVALADGVGPPGTVLDDGLLVACGDGLSDAREGLPDAREGLPEARGNGSPDASGSGALRLTRVQLAGRAAMDGAAFLRGHPVAPGTRLGL